MVERLLIVGLGSVGLRHLRLAREALPRAEIAVLRRPESSDSQAPGIDRVFTDLRAAVLFGAQAAVIANPASHHLATAAALAESGAHLLIEKPIASAPEGVIALIEACRSRGLALMTGYNLRFLPSLQRLHELVVAKRVGRVLSARVEVGQYLPTWRPDLDYRETVSARAGLGGGVLLELSHEIDYMRWLFGEVDWVSCVHRKVTDLEIDVEDTAHLILGFATDADGASLLGSLTLDFVRHDATRGATLVGETGTLRWNASAGTVEVFEKGAQSWSVLFEKAVERDETYRAEWRHFLGCIADGVPPRPSGEDGLAALHIIEAARLSNSTGCKAPVKKMEAPASKVT